MKSHTNTEVPVLIKESNCQRESIYDLSIWIDTLSREEAKIPSGEPPTASRAKFAGLPLALGVQGAITKA